MKRFLTLFIAASLMLIGTDAFAQRLTASGGFASFNLAGEDGSLVMDEALPGFYFGVNYDYGFSTIDGLTVEPGVYFMHFGKEFSYKGFEKSYHSNYIRVPINIKYETPLADGFAASIFTGPRFNIGAGGNMFSKGDSYMGLKLFDVQWGFGAAAMIQDAVMLRVGYDLGVTRCIKDNLGLGFEHLNTYRNTFYVGIGFVF